MPRLTRGRLRVLVDGLRRPARRRALSTCARAVLGENASARFDEFVRYRRGWDQGRGAPLRRGSIATLERFLALHPAFPTLPSLFLNRAGHLELAWEDGSARIELELLQNRVAFFITGDGPDREGEAAVSALDDVVRVDKEAMLRFEADPTPTNPAHAEIPQRITRGLSRRLADALVIHPR